MRHRKAGVKLNRTSSHRKAMFRNMVTSLFKYDRIKTTDAKAKELRRWADHIITLAKRGDLNARRQALAIVREKEVVHKLFEEAQKRFGKINGGYTRIVKLGIRPGDAAAVSLIELITVEAKPKKKKAAPKKKAAAAPATAKKAKEIPADEAAEKAADKAEAVEATEQKADEDKKEAKPAAKAKAPAKKAPAKKAPAKKAAAKKDTNEAKTEPKEKKAKAPAKKAPAKKDSEDKE